jgi:hypothetical protein
MIRIGSQVDLVVTLVPGMQLRVKPGDKVFAGETILIDKSLNREPKLET